MENYKDLQKKYGIEILNKEMWCWNSNPRNAVLNYIAFKKDALLFKYHGIDCYMNASTTKPTEVVKVKRKYTTPILKKL